MLSWQLLEEVVDISEERLQAQREQIVACLDKMEDWTTAAASHKNGTSPFPLMLQIQQLSSCP